MALPRIFVSDDSIVSGLAVISGDDAHHIARVLRKRIGDRLTLCDGRGTDYECSIESITEDGVKARILREDKSSAISDTRITLYMANPKADKMDMIVQKSVELGVYKIVPFISERCVSRPDEKASLKKKTRWCAIAKSAAEQCGAANIPEVSDICDFETAVENASKHDLPLFLYEGETATSIKSVLSQRGNACDISVFVGPEGGFSLKEAQHAKQSGMISVSLGARILRCETAPLAAICFINYEKF